MADKRGDLGGRVISGLAALAAAYCARKLITVVWTRVTGKEPPTDPEDPQVGWLEALGWASLVGVGGQTARLVATRVAAKRLHTGQNELHAAQDGPAT